MSEIRLSDRECLRPRLLDAGEHATARVEGVLERAPAEAGEASVRRFVERVVFDGERCRYRLLGGAGEAGRWIDENDAGEYRPYARLIVERLCSVAREGLPALHRFPGGPPSRALTRRARRLAAPDACVVRDAAVTVDGALWLRVELHRRGGWRTRPRAGDASASGWLPLDAVGAALARARRRPGADAGRSEPRRVAV